ncbi:hypothetical protein ACFQL0_20030 [Haloplanus litoreus]
MTLTVQDLDELLDEIFEDLEDHAELVDERLRISHGAGRCRI